MVALKLIYFLEVIVKFFPRSIFIRIFYNKKEYENYKIRKKNESIIINMLNKSLVDDIDSWTVVKGINGAFTDRIFNYESKIYYPSDKNTLQFYIRKEYMIKSKVYIKIILNGEEIKTIYLDNLKYIKQYVLAKKLINYVNTKEDRKLVYNDLSVLSGGAKKLMVEKTN